MTTTTKLNVTARELMQPNVICATVGDSLFDALELMTENHVTGVPVLSSKDRCVGLVSSSDILDVEHDGTGPGEFGRFYDPDTCTWQDVALTTFHKERLTDIRVADVMTTDLVSVLPDATLSVVCSTFANHDVHRLLVLDGEDALHGVITSTDIVRWLADQDLPA